MVAAADTASSTTTSASGATALAPADTAGQFLPCQFLQPELVLLLGAVGAPLLLLLCLLVRVASVILQRCQGGMCKLGVLRIHCQGLR